MVSQVVTLSFFQFNTPSNKWWAFKQMGLAPLELAKIPGLSFHKMLGSGNGNGFSIWPNFGVYGLLGVWESETKANDFFSEHLLFQHFLNVPPSILPFTSKRPKSMAPGMEVLLLPKNILFQTDAPMAVLTRATIRTSHLWRFWSFVPQVSKAMWREHQEGLLFSVGVGELPLVQQATFSLWKNSELMQAYAYKGKFHSEVVKKTRELGWYKEELFARFHPYQAEGTWKGQLMHDLLFNK